MNELADFFFNNIWLCLGLGVVAVVVGDEIFGFTRNVLGDGDEDRPRYTRARPAPPADPMGDLEDEEAGAPVEDLLKPKK